MKVGRLSTKDVLHRLCRSILTTKRAVLVCLSCLTIFAVNPLQGVMRNLLVEGCKETVGVHKYRLWFYMSFDSAWARHCWPYLPDATVTHTKGNTDFGDTV